MSALVRFFSLSLLLLYFACLLCFNSSSLNLSFSHSLNSSLQLSSVKSVPRFARVLCNVHANRVADWTLTNQNLQQQQWQQLMVVTQSALQHTLTQAQSESVPNHNHYQAMIITRAERARARKKEWQASRVEELSKWRAR